MSGSSERVKQNTVKPLENICFVCAKNKYKTNLSALFGEYLLHTFTSAFLQAQAGAVADQNKAFYPALPYSSGEFMNICVCTWLEINVFALYSLSLPKISEAKGEH